MRLIAENPKATLTIIAGAIVTLIVWILSFWNIIVPETVSIAMGILVAFLIGRFTRINKEEAELIKEQ